MSEDFVEVLADLEEEKAIETVKDRLDSGEDPLKIMDDIREAMSIVGDRFEEGQYFVPDLVFAGDILEEITDMVKEKMPADVEEERLGKVIIATVKDDIHDIGKNMVVFMLDVNGFEVHDMGVDVPPEEIVEKAEEVKPDIVGLSGFLTVAFDSMKETIEALEEEGLREDVKVMIGGGQVDEEVKEYVGADDYRSSAPAGVKLAKKWMKK